MLLISNVNEQTDQFKEVMNQAAAKVIGKKKTAMKPWITSEMLDKCDNRRKLKGKRNLSDEDMERYKEAYKAVNKEIRNAKERWINEKCEIIENNLHRNPKQANATVKKLTEDKNRNATTTIEGKDGRVLNDVEDILGRWKEYCEELYSYQIDKDDTILDILKSAAAPNETAPPIIKAEVTEDVTSLKDNKFPGVDNIQGELLKYGGEEVRKILQDILKTGIWPEDWKTSILILIPKKALFKCADHRTIALISHASKVMLKILQKRIAPTSVG
ncbi:uncharacterized protein [Montipora capricornis]|uniref:uncharacterized protein n=1 Tax=Montipora capricornis TaxID=246305 RepID=UPI0035F14174